MTTRSISAKLSSVFSTVKSRGLREGLKFASYRLYEEVHERRLGIRTTGLVSPGELGYESSEFFEYAPAPYHALRYCLARIPIRAGEDAFLDYGCGLGRVIIMAGTKPFRRVLGIDISPGLVEKARENIQQARKRLKCEVRADVADAQTYAVPDDITVVHFNNPFTGDTLAQAVGNIRESLRRRPRDLTIVFGSPGRFEEMFGGQDWLERKTFRPFYPNTAYAIYNCRLEMESR